MKNKRLFIVSGVFFVIGLFSVNLSRSVVCVLVTDPELAKLAPGIPTNRGEERACILRDNLLVAKPTKLYEGIASLIDISPWIMFGISGLNLIAAFTNEEKKD